MKGWLNSSIPVGFIVKTRIKNKTLSCKGSFTLENLERWYKLWLKTGNVISIDMSKIPVWQMSADANHFPALSESLSVDVAINGGGITGSIQSFKIG